MRRPTATTRAILSVAGEPSGDGRTYLVSESEARRWCADAHLSASDTDAVLADLAALPCSAHPVIYQRLPALPAHPERLARLLALSDAACAARTSAEHAAARSDLVRCWIAHDTHRARRAA